MATLIVTDGVGQMRLTSTTTLTLIGLEDILQSIGLPIPVPGFDQADLLNKPLDIGRCYFAYLLSNGAQCDFTTAGRSIQLPNNIEDGDLSIVLPKLRKTTDFNLLAFEILDRWVDSPLFIRPFHVPGDAHLRINFAPQSLAKLLLPYIEDRGADYGFDKSLGLCSVTNKTARKKLAIVFSSPNLAADFEGKHLRSTILGAHIARMYESVGWDVVRLNYLGDWGKSLALLGVGWDRFGSDEQFAKRPLRHILDVAHKIDELFKPEIAASRKARDNKEPEEQAKIESEGLYAERNTFFSRLEDGGDKELAFWRKIRNASVGNYEKLYRRLNIVFDEYSGESSLKKETMDEIEDILRRKGLIDVSDGAMIIDMKAKANMKSGTAVIRDRSGSSTYLLRDLAAVLERYRRHHFDELIVVVASDHNDHYLKLRKILELMDMSELAGKVRHASFSKISNIADEMDSSNTLRAILDHCQRAVQMALDWNKSKASLLNLSSGSAEKLAMNALIGQELSIRRATHQAFDQEHLTSLDPLTLNGPSTPLGAQYWYVALRSKLGNATSSTFEFGDDSFNDVDQSTLLRLLAVWPELIDSSYRDLEPSGLVSYLASVTDYVARCLEKSQDSISPCEAALYSGVKTVMENALDVLGMRLPD